nr:MAG TPA: Transcription initiation factor IIE, alpha FINGER, Transcription [Caudoviricetes sp.]
MKECNFIRKDDYDYIIYVCSNCKEEWYFEDGTPEDNSYNYCPKCGAKIAKVIELEEEEE